MQPSDQEAAKLGHGRILYLYAVMTMCRARARLPKPPRTRSDRATDVLGRILYLSLERVPVLVVFSFTGWGFVSKAAGGDPLF